MTRKQPENEQPAAEQRFEDLLGRLEKIVGDMEGGKLDLESMIAGFEEGQTLIKRCSQRLNEVERRIEKLVKKGECVETEPFADAPVEDEPSVAPPGELF